MIPNYQDRQIESSGVSDMAEFGISQDNSAHIMNILRDTLYSDKVLAVLREYSANAWDAHKMVGKGDIPIKVVLPTHIEPTLVIEDYGPGMSHEEIFRIYTQYGESTKRNTNKAVGQLGIGSKSGFAYSDSFTVISRNGGKQRTYVAVLDQTEKGVVNLLDEQDCGDMTGVTIQIPVRSEDIEEFLKKAENLFKFFEPRPDINISLPPEIPIKARLNTGIIYEPVRHGSGEWQAVMGCIPYRINLAQINVTDDETDKTGVGYWVRKLSGVLHFDIGEVHISASREELKYSKITKQTIVRRFTELVDEFVETTIAAIRGQELTSWERRLRAQILTNFDLPIPEEGKDLTDSYVEIQESPEVMAKTFCFVNKEDKEQDRHHLRHFYVNRDTSVVLCDDPRKLSGFQGLDRYDILLQRVDQKTSWEIVHQELDEYLKKNGLDGVPIVKLSDRTWVAPFVKYKPKKIPNPKYYRKSFVLSPPSPNRHFSSPYSKHWEPTDSTRVASDNDVFVILEGFHTDKHPEGFNLFCLYEYDRDMAEFFGLSMPSVYGYKTSEKKPLKLEDCAGRHYSIWRKQFHEELAFGIAKPYMETFDWQRQYKENCGYRSSQINMRDLGEDLGRNHQIYEHMKRITKAHKLWSKYSSKRQGAIRWLGDIYFKDESKNRSESKNSLAAIFAKYPLLRVTGGISCLWGSHKIQWIEYVQLIDGVSSTNVLTFTPVNSEEGEDEDG